MTNDAIIIHNLKDVIRDVIRTSIDDGRERGFLFYKYRPTGKILSSEIYTGWAKKVEMDWFELLEDKDGLIDPLGNFHTHFERAIPSYTDIGSMMNVCWELDGMGYECPYLICLVSIEQIDQHGINEVSIWCYEVDMDSNPARELRQFYLDLLNIAKKYRIWDINQLRYRCSERDLNEIDYLEDEMRGIIGDEELFYSVESITIDL